MSLIPFVLFFLSSGVEPRTGTPRMDDPQVATALAEARSAADLLTGSIRRTLFRHMGSGGPAAAVSACADSAYAISAEVERSSGVELRRVSLKVRNAANTPDSLETALLISWAAEAAAGVTPDTMGVWTLRMNGGVEVLHFMKPLFVTAPCLTCHGNPQRMAPDVRSVLRKRYPEDRAVGYKAGEIRGAVVAVVPVPR
jgi:hypothetical protein